MIRVLITDDHAVVRAGVRHMLSLDPDITIVGECNDGPQLLALLGQATFSADVLLLDLSLPKMHGLEVLRHVRQLRPGLAVLVLSMHAEEHFARRVMAAGAAGYLTKDRSDSDLLEAVRTVAQGRIFLSRSANLAQPGETRPLHETFTSRELQVFMLLIEGRSVSDIAAELGLGLSTVSTHVGKIRTKLGVQTIGEVVSYAHRAGLCG